MKVASRPWLVDVVCGVRLLQGLEVDVDRRGCSQRGWKVEFQVCLVFEACGATSRNFLARLQYELVAILYGNDGCKW